MPSECASRRAQHRLWRAATALAVGRLVGPELQRHRDHLGAPLALDQGRDRRVDTAAERDQHSAGPIGRQRLARSGQPRQRAVQCVSRQLRRVPVRSGEPAELGLHIIRADGRGVQEGRSIGHLGNGRGSSAAGSAALGGESHPLDDPVANRERNANQIPAGSTAGGAAERPIGLGPAP